jgi:hypothetical protein
VPRLPASIKSTIPFLLALATFVPIVVRAALTVDTYWDTQAYHWPFAARVAGLCGLDCFTMPWTYENRYSGFPKIWHAIQGLLWRVTGTPVFADMLSIAIVVALCVYLYRRFAVPLAWSWLGFVAIPEVQIQLTSSYIDLPLNAGITLALMALLRMTIDPEADSRPDVAMALAALAVAAGSKHQLVPVSLLVWGAIVLIASVRPSTIRVARSSTALAVLSVAGAIALSPKLIANLYMYGNPFFPIAIATGPIHFPGPEAMRQPVSISDAWAQASGPVRWLASVLEFDAFRDRPLPWTLGQGDVPQSNPSFRMGGYFGTYVLALLAVFAWTVRNAPRRRSIVALVVAMSVTCALMPLSHELRYYMFWMISLVSIALVLAHSPILAQPEQESARKLAHIVIVIAASSVILMTGADYLKTDGPELADLVRETNDAVARVPEGGTLCVMNRNRNAILYSTLFHPSRHYRTLVLFEDEPADCTTRLDLGPL